MSNNSIIISRDPVSGNVSAQLLNMGGENIGSVGSFTGSAILQFGTTDDGMESELMVNSCYGGANVNMSNASHNVSFWGKDLTVDITDNTHESNIQWNASGSKLSALNTNKLVNLESTAQAHDNIFEMGWGEANIIDSGSYNITQLHSGNTAFATTANSVGAVVYGGSGNNTFSLAGSAGVFVQENGCANFLVGGMMNAVFSSALGNIVEGGQNSLVVAANPFSSLTMSGIKSVGIVNSDMKTTRGLIDPDDKRSVVFNIGADSFKDDDGDVFSLANYLNDNGFSNLHVGEYTDWYFSGTGHRNHITSSLVASVLNPYLEMGDDGYKAQHGSNA